MNKDHLPGIEKNTNMIPDIYRVMMLGIDSEEEDEKATTTAIPAKEKINESSVIAPGPADNQDIVDAVNRLSAAIAESYSDSTAPVVPGMSSDTVNTVTSVDTDKSLKLVDIGGNNIELNLNSKKVVISGDSAFYSAVQRKLKGSSDSGLSSAALVSAVSEVLIAAIDSRNSGSESATLSDLFKDQSSVNAFFDRETIAALISSYQYYADENSRLIDRANTHTSGLTESTSSTSSSAEKIATESTSSTSSSAEKIATESASSTSSSAEKIATESTSSNNKSKSNGSQSGSQNRERDSSGRFISKSAQAASEGREDKRNKTLIDAINHGFGINGGIHGVSMRGDTIEGIGSALGGVYGSAAAELYRAVDMSHTGYSLLNRSTDKTNTGSQNTSGLRSLLFGSMWSRNRGSEASDSTHIKKSKKIDTASTRKTSTDSESEKSRSSIAEINDTENSLHASRFSGNPLTGMTGKAKLLKRREIKADIATVKTLEHAKKLSSTDRVNSKTRAKHHKEIMDMMGGIIKALSGSGLGSLASRLGGLGGFGSNGKLKSRTARGSRRGKRGLGGVFTGVGGNGVTRSSYNRSSKSGGASFVSRAKDSVKRGGGVIASSGVAAKNKIASAGKSLKGVRGLGALGALLSLGGIASTELSDMSREEKNSAHGEMAGRMATGTAGAMAGAAIGTAILPVFGTLIGGVVGGIAADYFVGDASAEIGGKLGSWLTNVDIEQIPGEIKAKFSEWTNNLIQSGIGQAITSKWDGVSEGVKNQFTQWTDSLKQSEVGQSIIDSWSSLTTDIQVGWSSLSTVLSSQWEDLSGKISKQWGDLSKFFSDSATFINGKIKDLTGVDISATVDASVEAVTAIAEKAYKVVNDLTEKASEAINEKAGAGGNIPSIVKVIASGANLASKAYSTYQVTKDVIKHAANKTKDYSTVSGLIHRGESIKRGYNDYNRGSDRRAASNKQNISLQDMSIAEIMEHQSLPIGHLERFFAVGKYQMIPKTMKAAVESLGVDKNAKFTPELQEKMFVEYLATKKKGRGGIENFIKGSGDLKTANLDIAKEWASVAYEGKTGYYDDVGNNRAHVSATEMRESLQSAREKYKLLTEQGMNEQKAYGVALGAYANEEVSTQTVKAVAPHAVAKQQANRMASIPVVTPANPVVNDGASTAAKPSKQSASSLTGVDSFNSQQSADSGGAIKSLEKTLSKWFTTLNQQAELARNKQAEMDKQKSQNFANHIPTDIEDAYWSRVTNGAYR